MWMRRGQQVEVPSPGQNRKVPAFGAIDYASGTHVSHVPKTEKGGKNSTQFLTLLHKLRSRARRTGKKILLVLDNGPIHTAKRVAIAMKDPQLRECIKLLWLPKYAPELNEQERVWKVAKEQGVANVLFKDKDSFRDHVAKVLKSINQRKRGALTVRLGQARRAQVVPKKLRTGT
jgi:transposase